MLRLSIAASILVSLVRSKALTLSECPEEPVPIAISTVPCENCIGKVQVIFKPDHEVVNARAEVVFTAYGTTVPPVALEDDLCIDGFFNTSCPLKPGVIVGYEHLIDIALTVEENIYKHYVLDKTTGDHLLCFIAKFNMEDE